MDNETEVILEQMEGTRASLAQKLETLENQVMGTIQDATTSVSETVQQVKDAVSDTVETVKDTVEGTVESMKETVDDTVESVKETFNVRHQVKRHPWLMFGGSLAAGFVASRIMGRYLPRRLPPWQAESYYAEPPGSMPPPSYYQGRGQGAPDYAAGMAEQPRQERAPPPEPPQKRPSLLDNLASMLGPEVGKLKGLAIGATLGIVRDLITQSAPPELGTQLAEMVNGFTTRLGGEVIHGPVLPNFTDGRSPHAHDQDPGAQEPAAAQYAYRTGTTH
jgi:ElaB/YqjD/DUF883 family membrane-anchored ribosome-binding protein